MSVPFIEAVKEFLRVGILAAVAMLIESLVAILSGNAVTLDVKLIVVSSAIAVLRAIDKWLYKSGVSTPLDFG